MLLLYRETRLIDPHQNLNMRTARVILPDSDKIFFKSLPPRFDDVCLSPSGIEVGFRPEFTCLTVRPPPGWKKVWSRVLFPKIDEDDFLDELVVHPPGFLVAAGPTEDIYACEHAFLPFRMMRCLVRVVDQELGTEGETFVRVHQGRHLSLDPLLCWPNISDNPESEWEKALTRPNDSRVEIHSDGSERAYRPPPYAIEVSELKQQLGSARVDFERTREMVSGAVYAGATQATLAGHSAVAQEMIDALDHLTYLAMARESIAHRLGVHGQLSEQHEAEWMHFQPVRGGKKSGVTRTSDAEKIDRDNRILVAANQLAKERPAQKLTANQVLARYRKSKARRQDFEVSQKPNKEAVSVRTIRRVLARLVSEGRLSAERFRVAAKKRTPNS